MTRDELRAAAIERSRERVLVEERVAVLERALVAGRAELRAAQDAEAKAVAALTERVRSGQ